jgi:hypothetical protein
MKATWHFGVQSLLTRADCPSPGRALQVPGFGFVANIHIFLHILPNDNTSASSNLLIVDYTLFEVVRLNSNAPDILYFPLWPNELALEPPPHPRT